MVEEQPARPQQPVHGVHVGVELGASDVLVHADARDLVERLLVDLAIVEDAHLGAIAETGRCDTPARQLRLRLRQRHAECVHAVARGRVHHERAPAAADVEQALPRPQAQLAADQLELALLGGLERVACVREVRARVDQARPEQELVEAVRDVVVVAHRRLVASQRVQASRRCCLAFAGSAAAAAHGARPRSRAEAASRARSRRPSARPLTRCRRPSTRSRSPSTSSAPDTQARPSPSWLGARRKYAIARSSRMSTTGASGPRVRRSSCRPRSAP